MAFENIKKLQQAQQVQTTGTPAASTSASNSTTSQPIDMKSKTVTEEQKIQVMVDFLNSGEYKNCPDEDKAELLKQKFPNLAAEELNKYVTAAKIAIEEKAAQQSTETEEEKETPNSESKKTTSSTETEEDSAQPTNNDVKKEKHNPFLRSLKNKVRAQLIKIIKENYYQGITPEKLLEIIKAKAKKGQQLTTLEEKILENDKHIDDLEARTNKNKSANNEQKIINKDQLITRDELQSEALKDLSKKEKINYAISKFLANSDEDYINLPEEQQAEYVNTYKDIIENFIKENNPEGNAADVAKYVILLNNMHELGLTVQDLNDKKKSQELLTHMQEKKEDIEVMMTTISNNDIPLENRLEQAIIKYCEASNKFEGSSNKNREKIIKEETEKFVKAQIGVDISNLEPESKEYKNAILQATTISYVNNFVKAKKGELCGTTLQAQNEIEVIAYKELINSPGCPPEVKKELEYIIAQKTTLGDFYNAIFDKYPLDENSTGATWLEAINEYEKMGNPLPKELELIRNDIKSQTPKEQKEAYRPPKTLTEKTIADTYVNQYTAVQQAQQLGQTVAENAKNALTLATEAGERATNSLCNLFNKSDKTRAEIMVHNQIEHIKPEDFPEHKDEIIEMIANTACNEQDPNSDKVSHRTECEREAWRKVLKEHFGLSEQEIDEIMNSAEVTRKSVVYAPNENVAKDVYNKGFENLSAEQAASINYSSGQFSTDTQADNKARILTEHGEEGAVIDGKVMGESDLDATTKTEIMTKTAEKPGVSAKLLAKNAESAVENTTDPEAKEQFGAGLANSGYAALLEGAAAASDSIDVPAIREQYESMIKQASQNYPPEINKLINEVLKSGVISEATRNNSQPARNSYYPEADRYVEIINKYYNNSNSTGHNNQTSDNRSSNNVGNNYNTQENTYSTPRQTTYEQPVVQNHNEPIISQQTDYSTPDIINTVRYTDSGVRSTLNSFDTPTSNSSANGSTSRYNPTVDATGSTPSTYSTYSTTPTSSTSYVDPAKVEAEAIAQQVAANEEMKELAMANVEEVKQAIDESIAEWELKQQLKLNDEVIEELKQAVVSEAIEDVISTSKTKKRAIFEKLSSANSVSEVYDILLSALGTKVHEKFINRLAKAGSVGDVHAFIKSRAGNTDLIKQILMKTSSISLKSELIALLPDSDVLELLDKNLINTLENVDHQVIYTYVSKNIYSLTQTNFANYLKYLPFDEREKLIEMRNKAFGIQPENAEAEAEVEIAQSATEAQAPQQNSFGNAFAQTNPVTQSANPMTQPEQNPLASKPKKADNSAAEAPQTKFKAGETTKTLSDGRVITNQGTTFAGVSNNAYNDEGFRVVDPKKEKQKEGAPIGMNDEVLTPGSPEWYREYDKQAPTTAFTMAALDDDMENDGLNLGSNRVKIGQPIKKKYNTKGFNARG